MDWLRRGAMLVFVVTVSCAAAGEASKAITLPPQLENDAKKAYAEGKQFFIWLGADKEPLESSTLEGLGPTPQQWLLIPINYSARDDKPAPFLVNLEIVCRDRYTREFVKITTTWGNDQVAAKTGRVVAVFLPKTYVLSGRGTATVCLVAKNDDKQTKNPISNTFTCTILMKDSDKSSGTGFQIPLPFSGSATEQWAKDSAQPFAVDVPHMSERRYAPCRVPHVSALLTRAFSQQEAARAPGADLCASL